MLDQPDVKVLLSWKVDYLSLIRSVFTILILPWRPMKIFVDSLILFHLTQIRLSLPYPNQAFTVGPRINDALREQMLVTLQLPAGKQATTALRARFSKGKDMVPANPDEYKDVAVVLKDFIGFEF